MSYSWLGPKIVKRVRDAIITAYRNAFSYDPDFTYVTNANGTVNFDCSKVVINDSTPDDYYFLPSINVTTTSGEEHRFLQEDFFGAFQDLNGNMSPRRGAPLDIRATVEATALDVITRDRLVDRLYELFKVVNDALADNGVGLLRTSIRADSRKFEHDRWYYTSGVELSLYAEWLEEDTTVPVTIDDVEVTVLTSDSITESWPSSSEGILIKDMIYRQDTWANLLRAAQNDPFTPFMCLAADQGICYMYSTNTSLGNQGFIALGGG